MGFTPEAKQKWLEEKRSREKGVSLNSSGTEQGYTCLHCHNSFTAHEGTLTQEAFICDVCND